MTDSRETHRRCMYLALFSQATLLDVWLMVVAGLLALLHGAVLPAAMLVFGLLTNAFVNQYSSAQLANYELSFDPLTYIEMGRLAAVDVRVIVEGFINFTNITGGVVNCSDSYELLPFNQSFDDILKLGITELASCLDNPTFLALVTRYTLVFVGLAVVAWILGGAHVALFSVAGRRQVMRLRDRLFSSLVWQELGWFDATSPGKITSRLTEDVGRVQDGLAEKMGLLLQWLATLVAGVTVSLVTEWRLTLLMGFAGLLIAMSTAVLSVVTSLSTSHTLSLSAIASSIAEEALVAVKTVKAFCAEDEETQRYSFALSNVRRRGQCVGVVSGLCLGTVQLLVFSCYAGSFWLGAYLVQEELIQAGQFVTVFFAVLLVGVSIGQALPHVQRLVAAETAARTLQGLVARVPLIDVLPEGVWPANGLEPSVEFQNVSFSYPTRREVQVLTGVNLKIRPGQMVAVVGATGSGKSTLGHLLTRLYDVTGGQVLVGGYNVCSLLTDRLREMVGVVSQDSALFQTTIAQNIQYGSVGVASQEDIEWAARQAHAHDFISALPDGYSTLVGPRGSQLSGGQKQRIAIARALVRNPKILLLDEATSALDTESEKIVQEALDKAREGRTTIVIAHRLSTVCRADTIVVMEGGVVMEVGSHDQLLQQEGVYYNLVHAQLPALDSDGTPGSPGNIHVPPSLASSAPVTGCTEEWNEVGQVEWNKDTDNVSWFRVLRLSGAEWPLLVSGAIAAGIQGAIFPSFSIFFGQALEAFTFPFFQVLELTHKWAGLFLGLGFVSAVATVIKIHGFSLAGERLTYRLRVLALRCMLRHPMSWFDSPSSSPSGLAAMLAADTPLVQGVIRSLSSLTEVGVGLLVAVVIAMMSSWVLALVVLGFVPLLVAAGLVQVWLLGKRRSSSGPSQSSQVTVECVLHMQTVQLFGLQEAFTQRFRSALKTPLRVMWGETVGVGVVYGFANFILLLAYAVTFRFAAYLLTLPVDHTLYANFDEVFTVFLAVILGSLAAGQASAALPLATQATSAAGRILGVMAPQVADEEAGNAEGDGRSLESVRAVRLVGVSFSFPARPIVPVLSELSLAVDPGHCLALVGPSGAGKSTILALLERFYSPHTGAVLLNDTNLSTIGLRWWRRQLGWVPQDTILFNRSIADNIAYGCHGEVDQTLIEKAAITANIHSFIESLPHGYSTLVGPRGSQLSGGQKQRIAIARALVRNPKILLLDEATSALDTESEKMVQEALDKAREGRTTIVIAHRLSTVARADHIAVLQAGRVVEEGNHVQLLQRRGVYWRLSQQKKQS